MIKENIKLKIDGYVNDVIIASWDKEIKDFKLVLIKCGNEPFINNESSKEEIYSLVSRFVNGGHNLTILEELDKELKESLNIDVVMYRHIAVFDSPNRDPRGYIVSNLMLAIVDDVSQITRSIKNNKEHKIRITALENIDKFNLCLDYKEMILKFKKLIDYDIYSQIFDTQKFGSDFIVSLLGDKFTTSELIELAKWAGREENKTTFYRNIDNNYEFLEKVGRNKYYTKKDSSLHHPQ